MNVLRTPDDRFDALPGFDFAPHYVEVADSARASDAARPLPRRGARRRAGGPAHARRAVVVLPLPQDDPGPHRRRAPGGRARPGRLRPLRQARRAAATTPTPATSSGCAAALFDRLELSRRHPGRPGLGRPHRPAPGGRAPRALRPGGGRQHRPAHRRHRPGRRLLRLAEVLPGGADVPDRASSSRAAACPTCPPEVSRRLRRPVPRRDLQGGGPPVPDARARRAPTIRPPTPTVRAWEVLARVRPALPVRLQRRRPHHPRRRPHLHGAGPGRAGPAPHDHRRRRALPPGGQGRGAGRGGRSTSSTSTTAP